ncbi:O-antigen ligase family protein [Marinicellulosiphila megalodicopiae]|uniref:O-antigen ligase family protein n=1 Tax=Marinicellulosiphila megalodicopiae TaxID=2724896 RepID=UPI003BAFDF55
MNSIQIAGSQHSTWMVWLLGLVMVWSPIPLGSNRIWAWSLLELIIFSLMFLHLVLCFIKKQTIIQNRFTFYVISAPVLLAGFLMLQSVCVFQFVCSADVYQTQQLFLKTLGFIFFIILICQYIYNQKTLRLFLGFVVVAGCIQTTYGSAINLLGIQESIVFGFNEGDRARGSFVYQNHFANYLGLVLCLAIGLMLSELKTEKQLLSGKALLRDLLEMLLSKKFILRLGIIIMIIGLILSRSRMGNSAFFVAFFMVSIFAIFYYRKPPITLKWIVLSIFIIDIIVVGMLFGLEKVKDRIVETSFASETRDEVVRDSLPIIQENFWTGTGGGSFYGVFPSYQPEEYSLFYDHAHNDYVQFAVEFGVPITIMLGLYCLYALFLNFQTMRQRKTKLYQGVAFGCAMGIIYMLIHITVDFNLQAPANALLFLTIISLSFIVRYIPSKN